MTSSIRNQIIGKYYRDCPWNGKITEITSSAMFGVPDKYSYFIYFKEKSNTIRIQCDTQYKIEALTDILNKCMCDIEFKSYQRDNPEKFI